MEGDKGENRTALTKEEKKRVTRLSEGDKEEKGWRVTRVRKEHG